MTLGVKKIIEIVSGFANLKHLTKLLQKLFQF
jgi:hypothetical protein